MNERTENFQEVAEGLAPKKNDPSRLMERSGAVFIVVSAVSFVVCMIMLYMKANEEHHVASSGNLKPWIELLSEYTAQIAAFLIGVFTSIVGYFSLRAAGAAKREVIPRQDAKVIYELLLQNNNNGLNGYIRLSGLSGFVGLCTKLGISGLPLATIALSMFFSVLGFLSQSSNLFDLAELTLGAFIGSYVQRQSNDEQGGNAWNTGHERPKIPAATEDSGAKRELPATLPGETLDKSSQ